MPLEKRELSYLWDMRNAASEIHEFMRGVRFSQFEKDKVMRYATERLRQIIFHHNSVKDILKSHGRFLSSSAIFLPTSTGKVCSPGYGSRQRRAHLNCLKP